MAKQSNQKLRLLYINKILHELTDEFHGITLLQLSSELAGYGIRAERKTLYDDIECLRLFGVDIRARRDSRVWYYVAERELSSGEIMLLSDLADSSSALSTKEKRDLKKRLFALGGKYAFQSARLPEGDGEDVFEIDAMQNAELICHAMEADKKISCRCFDWNAQKQRILCDGGRTFVFSPWYADLSERLIFIACDENKVFKEIRADRVLDVKILDSARDGRNEFDGALKKGVVSRIANKELPQMLRFRAPCDMMNDIIDRFGLGISVTSRIEDKIEFSARVAPDAKLFSWLFINAGRVELISPESVCREYHELLKIAAQDLK